MKEIFKEETGKLSLARITAIVLILAYLAGFIYIFIQKHILVDIPSNLMFLITGLYGINKFATVANNYNNNKQS